jgi:hypothetical protein
LPSGSIRKEATAMKISCGNLSRGVSRVQM